MPLIILNFHGVGPIPRTMDEGERNCWLDQSFFESVLDLVRTCSHVRLTVDDGNRSDFETVLPALLRRGLQATFFLCSHRLDQPTFLSRTQVREMLGQGMGIGSHGVEHRSWRRLPDGKLEEELESSRRTLEAVCGASVDTAACPFGDYDSRVLRKLRRTGYRSVFTSDGGATAENRWLKARTTVTRTMTLEEIRQLVQPGPTLASQWMINLRKLYKCLR